jgi:adenylate cyclase
VGPIFAAGEPSTYRLTPEACWTIALSSVPAVPFLLCSPMPGDAMKQPAQRRLAAILAADVAGYSRLMGADEEGTHERFKTHCRQLVDPKIKEHRGRIVKNTGDGMLAEFPSVVDAVRCAVEVQRAMVDRNAETAGEKRIAFRIGVNLGDVIAEPDDIYGDGVNIAARLEALAEPGGICVSRVVRDQIRDKLPYPFEDMGEQSVKNIARPVRAYAMSAAAAASTPLLGAPAQSGPSRGLTRPRLFLIAASVVAAIAFGTLAWWGWPKANSPTVPAQLPTATHPQGPSTVATAPPPRLSFVVLPFTNLSSDPDQEYFVEGITDDLTTDLSRISGSFVIARNTAFTYKGKPVDVKQIGHELRVRYVIEGSVRRSGNQVQVNVQLIDAETGAHLWADRFDTDRAKLAETQNEITGRLARTLNIALVQAAQRGIERERTVDPNARDLVMRGWARFDWSDVNRSETQPLFERALKIDPQSVSARLGVARILIEKLTYPQGSAFQQDETRAEQLLTEALKLDGNRADIHAMLGLLRRVQNRLTESRAEWEAAVALDRNNSWAYSELGTTLMYLGEPEAAIPHIEKAMRLNPGYPYIAGAYWGLGACHLLLGHVDEAIELLGKARAANPRPYFIHLWLAGALGLRGDLDEARASLAEVLKLKPELTSLAQIRIHYPWSTNPRHLALRNQTIDIGLRKAGFPDE